MQNISIHRHPISEDQHVDLSSLPDDIILHILEFLEGDVAFRTLVLSKRFAEVWPNLRRLTFYNCTTDFIDKTLTLHNKSCLHKLALNHNYPSRRVHEVDKWIEVISVAKVKEVSLNIVDYSYNKYVLKEHIFKNQSLDKLKLVYCDIKAKGVMVKWDSLRSLEITHSTLSDQCLSILLKGSPSLEELKLRDCLGLRKLSINNRCLKTLKISSLKCDQIIAPNLECLTISGKILVTSMRILNVGSLVRVCVNFKGTSIFGFEGVVLIRSLLEDVSHAYVIVGEWCERLLSRYPNIASYNFDLTWNL